MNKVQIKNALPTVGILAFSACSVESLHGLLDNSAGSLGDTLWFAAVMVELTTAWLVFQVVEQGRRLTRSNISKQDRRFYGIMFVVFAILSVPSLALSFAANTVEFSTPWLGWVFPVMSVGCAVGAAMPGVEDRYRQTKADEKQIVAERKAEKAKSKAEAGRQMAEKAQREAEKRQVGAELEQTLGSLSPSARSVLDELRQTPGKSQADMAQALGIKRQSVGYHVGQLKKAGLVTSNGSGTVATI